MNKEHLSGRGSLRLLLNCDRSTAILADQMRMSTLRPPTKIQSAKQDRMWRDWNKSCQISPNIVL